MRRPTFPILPVLFIALLLIWGVYTFLYYLGVPVHGLVLLPDGLWQSVQQTCDGEAHKVCIGLNTFFTFVIHTIGRAVPFLWLAVSSAILYGVLLGWRFMREGRMPSQFVLTPLRLTLLFLLMLWLGYTSISGGNVDGVSVRRIVEPSGLVYQGVSQEGIQRLQENFDRLDDAGCLKSIGNLSSGAGVYEMKTRCIQASFFTRIVPPFVFVLFFIFEILILGRGLLSLLRLKIQSLLTETGISIALGICGWIVVLWLVAVLGIFTQVVAWLLLIAVPVICYRQVKVWFDRLLHTSVTLDRKWHDVGLILAWLLFGYLAINFINVVRPFPIGWDDLGSYMNRPRLLASYGTFIHSMASFQWEYLTALGFTLFGYESVVGVTFSMIINWTAGLFAVLVIYLFSRRFIGGRAGILAALLYYTLPMVGHFSYADMKIDNAVFLMGAFATFSLFSFLFSSRDEEGEARTSDIRWLILAGLFVGFAFGMKATSIMVAMALGAILLGVMTHWVAFIGAVFLASAIFVRRGALNFGRVIERVLGDSNALLPSHFVWGCIAIGVLIIGIAFLLRRGNVRTTFKATVIFIASFLAAIVPWIAHNNYLYGNIVPKMMLGAPNMMSPVLDYDVNGLTQEYEGRVIKSLPQDLRIDTKDPECQPTGHIEELDRYWGFDEGWNHYITLPWRTVMNINSAGYYVTTTPGLLLFPLLLLLPAFWSRGRRWLRWLFLGTIFMLYEWMFLANGIPWYGIGVFLGLAVGLEALFVYAPGRVGRTIAGVFLGLALLTNFGQRFWQFEQQRNLFEYPTGKVTKEALLERTIPHYNDIINLVKVRSVTMPDRPYLYRVGTFIPYFIPKNLEVIAATDHQLDMFNCLNQERDAALTVQRLKGLGFNSIIFDTNTATIERDSSGSLHRKVQAFVDFVNDPASSLDVVVYDMRAGVSFILIP